MTGPARHRARLSATLSCFVRLNRMVCSRLERRLPQRRLDISLLYERTVGTCMRSLPAGAVVVDAGGGRKCPYAEHKPAGITIVAVDISEKDLKENTEADQWLRADISSRLPFADAAVDLVTSKHVLEHLPDPERFIAETARVLKPGGYFINLLPSRYALFAYLSRTLPEKMRQRALALLHPETSGTQRLPAVYKQCYARALEQMLIRHGFAIETTTVSYYGSHYFGFLVPIYLLVATWELLLLATGARDLGAAILVCGRKRAPAADPPLL